MRRAGPLLALAVALEVEPDTLRPNLTRKCPPYLLADFGAHFRRFDVGKIVPGQRPWSAPSGIKVFDMYQKF